MRPASPGDQVIKDDKPQKMDFLVSFLVDARGGSMTGSRRSGVRVVIPPQSAEQPVRVTIRQLRPDQVLCLPPLSDGEALASRIIQVLGTDRVSQNNVPLSPYNMGTFLGHVFQQHGIIFWYIM